MVGLRSVHAIWMHEGQSLSLTLRAAKLCKSAILPICPAIHAGMTAYFNNIGLSPMHRYLHKSLSLRERDLG